MHWISRKARRLGALRSGKQKQRDKAHSNLLYLTYLPYLMTFTLQAVKEGMDKRFGPQWQVAVGGSFAYRVTHVKEYLFFYLGSAGLGFLVWRV